MRWTKPQVGDIRKVIRFAWLPVSANHPDELLPRHWVWLEKYLSIEMYAQRYDGVSIWEGWGDKRRELLDPPKKNLNIKE